MQPISLKFLARQFALLLAAMALAYIVSDWSFHGLLTACAAALFLCPSYKISRHVANPIARQKNLRLLTVTMVQCFGFAFAILFLSSNFAFLPFLVLVALPYVYFAVTT